MPAPNEKRRREIQELLSQGLPVLEIARRLRVSPQAIYQMLARIKREARAS